MCIRYSGRALLGVPGKRLEPYRIAGQRSAAGRGVDGVGMGMSMGVGVGSGSWGLGGVCGGVDEC